MTSPTIWYIHGANASPVSFNYIKSQLYDHKAVDLIYSARDPIEDTIAIASDQLKNPVHIIAHSLGGVIAVALSQIKPHLVRSVVTLGTPYGGSEIATRASVLMPFDPFIKNISTFNPTLLYVRSKGAVVPTLTIITNNGINSFESAPNDGVVTVSSQMALENPTIQVQMSLNHFESLINPNTVDLIKQFHKNKALP